MKLLLHAPALSKAVKAIQPITTPTASLPQLGGVTLSASADGKRMAVSGSDLNIWATRYLDCEWTGPAVTVPSGRLHGVLSRISEPEVILEVSETACTILAGNMECTLPLITDPPILPPVAEYGEAQDVPLLAQQLDRMLPFTSKTNLRPAMIHMAKGKMEASDGRVFISILIDCKADHVIPAELARMVADNRCPSIKVRFAPGMAEFTGEDWCISGKLLEAQFPNTSMFFNQPVHTRILANAKAMAEAAEFAALPLSKAVDSIWCRVSEGSLRFHTPGYRVEAKKFRGQESTSQTVECAASHCQDFAISASDFQTFLKGLGAEEATIQLAENPVLLIAQANNTLVGCSLRRLET